MQSGLSQQLGQPVVFGHAHMVEFDVVLQYEAYPTQSDSGWLNDICRSVSTIVVLGHFKHEIFVV